MWNVATTVHFDNWFATLEDDAKTELIAKVRLLQAIGPGLRRPHADKLKGSRHANMRELRGRTNSAVLRVAYAFDPDRDAILLVGGEKQGVNEARFYRSLIDKADKLFDEHLRRLDARKRRRS